MQKLGIAACFIVLLFFRLSLYLQGGYGAKENAANTMRPRQSQTQEYLQGELLAERVCWLKQAAPVSTRYLALACALQQNLRHRLVGYERAE